MSEIHDFPKPTGDGVAMPNDADPGAITNEAGGLQIPLPESGVRWAWACLWISGGTQIFAEVAMRGREGVGSAKVGTIFGASFSNWRGASCGCERRRVDRRIFRRRGE